MAEQEQFNFKHNEVIATQYYIWPMNTKMSLIPYTTVQNRLEQKG